MAVKIQCYANARYKSQKIYKYATGGQYGAWRRLPKRRKEHTKEHAKLEQDHSLTFSSLATHDSSRWGQAPMSVDVLSQNAYFYNPRLL